MPAVETQQPWATLELAYQQYDAIERAVETSQFWVTLELAYQQYAPEVGVPLPTLTEYILKIVNNIVAFAFLGKAWLFDGATLKDFGSPAVAIYPTLISDGEKAYFTGGLNEDGTIDNTIYGYATVTNQITADRNYFAMVVAGEEPVYLVNEMGTIMHTFTRSGATPLLTGWKLISKSSFYAIILKI
jgi:hypothetical protein